MHTGLAETRFTPIDQQHSMDISDRVCPMTYEVSERSGDAGRTLLGCRVGPVGLAQYVGRGIEHGQRTIEHIRAEPHDYFLLCVPIQAHFHFSHMGLESDVGRGTAVLLSAQR